MYIRSGAFDKENNPSKIPKSMLEKYFPDSTERMDYQNQQFEFLQSGRKKIREAHKLRMNESQKLKLLTPQEKDAFDYFSTNLIKMLVSRPIFLTLEIHF